jgi:hypothetical protein
MMMYNIKHYWFLDFAHRPEFQMLENTAFRKQIQFPKRCVF